MRVCPCRAGVYDVDGYVLNVVMVLTGLTEVGIGRATAATQKKLTAVRCVCTNDALLFCGYLICLAMRCSAG